MTTDREMERIVRSWLEPGLTTLTDDVLDPVLDQLPATPQRRPKWSPRRVRTVSSYAKFSLATAALLVVAVVGINLANRSGQPIVGTTPTSSPSLSASPAALAPTNGVSPAASEAPFLPALRLPGTIASPAGNYGWQGGAGQRAGMHKVIGDGETSRESTELVFAVGPQCLAAGQEAQPVPVHIAGFDGVVVEPYEPPVTFSGPNGDETTRAVSLGVGDRTLCVFVTWHATTTDDEFAAAAHVLETLRAVPIGEDSIRITFKLDGGWDVG